LAATAGLQQKVAHAAPAPASTAIETCASKALGVGRVATSPNDCRADEYYAKDGDLKQYKAQKTFRLSGEPDGTWQIAGW
jgi:hypothetical protein